MTSRSLHRLFACGMLYGMLHGMLYGMLQHVVRHVAGGCSEACTRRDLRQTSPHPDRLRSIEPVCFAEGLRPRLPAWGQSVVRNTDSESAIASGSSEGLHWHWQRFASRGTVPPLAGRATRLAGPLART
jgi:hypothetical protein